jgi:hypothetical protein
VANHCGHETGASADLVGHHGHASHDHGSPAADPGNTEAPATGLDCGQCHCHGHCVGMFELPRAFEALAPGGAPPGLRNTTVAEPLLAKPERPQWSPLA